MEVSQTTILMNERYIKVLRFFMWTFGAWAGETVGETTPLLLQIHKLYLPVQAVCVNFAELTYIFKKMHTVSFFVIGHCFIVWFLTILTGTRDFAPRLKQYKVIFKHFFTKFHLIHFKHLSEYHQKMFTIIEKFSNIFTYYLMLMMMGGMFLFNVSPWYLNYINGVFTGNRNANFTLEFSVYYLFPGFDPNDHFRIATLFNFYLSYICATAVCCLDLYLSLIVFQIIGHILILRNSLETIPKPKKQITVKFDFKGDSYEVATETYDEEENKVMLKKLTECVNHNKFISQFTNDISSFFGPILALNYAFDLFSCCLLLLECSQTDPAAIFRFGPLTIIIFGQLIQLSVTFEVVDTVSSKLKDSVYGVPWECMSNENRRIVSFFLMNVQEPMRVTALGVTPVGVTTMAGILKTTFSYYMFLRQMDI